jgi:hypothetical protein
MTNAIAVADQEHPDHQLGIHRGPTLLGLKRASPLEQRVPNGTSDDMLCNAKR